jgi:capsular exopolysaccharide synthesis family protein
MSRYVTPTDGTIVPSLLDYLRVLGRRKILFLLIVLLVPAAAVAASLNQTPTYRASAEVLLDPQDLGEASIDPQRVAATRAELARVPAVVDQVLDAVASAGLDRKEFLASSTVSATLGLDLLTFSVENSDPRLAARLATEYANAFTEYQRQLDAATVKNELKKVRHQLAELEASGEAGAQTYFALQHREEALASLAAAQTPSAQVVDPASAGEAPKVAPRTVRNGLLACCLGLLLALVVVFLADALDTRVRSVDAIRATLGVRLLGRLAKPPARVRERNDLIMLADPTSPDAEQYRALRWSLDLANADHGARTIMITSAVDGEGKSTTVANLAVALARAGSRVVVIDADLSHPHLHRLFDLDQGPVQVLQAIGPTEDSSRAEASSRRIEQTGSLELIPAGSALHDSDELGVERAVARIIRRVRGDADLVLVDSPPVVSGNAIALSALVDAVVVVVRLNAVPMSALEHLHWTLEASPAIKLGFVVTGDDKSEGYGSYQRYGPSNRRRVGRPRPKATVPPSAADGEGDVRSWRPAETQAVESETNGRGAEPASGAPAEPRSKSAARPFGGLSPREAAMRSAQSRSAKSAERAEEGERAAAEGAQDAIEEA